MKMILSSRICKVFLMLIVSVMLMGNAAVAEEGGMKALDINTATVKELSKLPGLGKVKAEAIVAFRDKNGTFSSVDDLKKVKGIGKKTLEKLREYVAVKGS